MTKLSIIIPAYNEEKNLEKTIKGYLKFFRSKKILFEIIIIPNNCTDSTPKIAKKLSKNKEVKQKIFPKLGQKGQAKGQAVIEGVKLAKGEYVSFVDADNSTPPPSLYDLLQNIGDYACIMGSRWMKGSKIIKKQPLSRRIASRAFNLLVRLILNLQFSDTQCGSKIFKRQAILKILPKIVAKGWAFDVGILFLLKKHNYRIKEFPITWSESETTTLKVHTAAPKMLKSLFKIRFS